MEQPDDLYSLRDNFWLGNYQNAIEEGKEVIVNSDQLKVERDVYVYRSYIAQGQPEMVLSKVGDQSSSPPSLLAVKLLATYLTQPASNEMVLDTLKEWLNDPLSGNNPTLQLMAGVIYMKEGIPKEALRALRSATTLEMVALSLQIYLKLDRVDLATKQHQLMQNMDDDSTLTQLASAWISLSTGGERYKEATYIYQELINKHGPTPLLLTGLGSAYIHIEKYSEAEKILTDSLSRDKNVDTLINLIVCAQHTRKEPKVVDGYISQIRSLNPKHHWLLSYDSVEKVCGQVAASFGAM